MKYNSNDILKIEHFFHIPKNKGKKRWKSNICIEKYMFMLLFPPIFPASSH